MRLNKRVAASTIMAMSLIVVTAVTAIQSDASLANAGAEEKVAEVTVKNNGVAGIIGELAVAQISTERKLNAETASKEKTESVTVGEAAAPADAEESTEATESTETAAAEAAPQQTPEEQEWSNKLMANVEESLNVRSQADENSDVIGKLHRGDRAEITEQLDGWYHIVSGNVDGFVKAEYCVTGNDALNLARQVCTTVAAVQTGGLRIRAAADESSEVYAAAAEGDKLTVKTDVENIDGWVTVDYNGKTAYVKADYVVVSLSYGTGITIEEEQAQLAKAAAEAAAKKAAQTTTTALVQNAAVAASADDVTLLGALIQCEAGSEPYEGMVAVGAVVMNRVRSGAYSSSIYGVIYQGGQFTPAGNGGVASVIASGVSGACIQAAQAALSGKDNTGGATNFRRASSGHAGVVIGNHVFY